MSAHTTSRGPEFNPAMQADEPLTPFDVTQSSERVGMVKLALGFGFLLALAFLVFKIYNPEGTRDRNDPPLITAENTPFKIVPEDQGGLQTPDQDKEVFDVMSGDAPSTDVITLPQPEQPVDRPDRAPIEEAPVVEEVPPTIEQSTPPPSRVEPEPVRVEPEPAPAPRRPAPAVTSDWVVQVASLRSQAEAERTYAAIESRHGAILSGYAADIVRVDLADKGIYFRARVGGLASRDEATRVCDRLKAAGQSCFVARR